MVSEANHLRGKHVLPVEDSIWKKGYEKDYLATQQKTGLSHFSCNQVHFPIPWLPLQFLLIHRFHRCSFDYFPIVIRRECNFSFDGKCRQCMETSCSKENLKKKKLVNKYVYFNMPSVLFASLFECLIESTVLRVKEQKGLKLFTDIPHLYGSCTPNPCKYRSLTDQVPQCFLY